MNTKGSKGPKERVGTYGHTSLHVGIVVSRFHAQIADRLVCGAMTVFKREGVRNIKVIEVPGAFEVPGVALQMGRSGRFDVLLCLGAVIQGETDHYHYICSEVSRGVGQVALTIGIPVVFGILTTASLRQAMARSSGRLNKGGECAETAIYMGQLYRSQGWKK